MNTYTGVSSEVGVGCTDGILVLACSGRINSKEDDAGSPELHTRTTLEPFNVLCHKARIRALWNKVVVFHLIDFLVFFVAGILNQKRQIVKEEVNKRAQESKVSPVVLTLPGHEVVLVRAHVPTIGESRKM